MAFEGIQEQISKDIASGSGPTETGGSTDLAPSSSSTAPEGGQAPTTQAEIVELDKLQKFKFGNEELTPAELKQRMLMQKDYSSKTVKLAEERRTWEEKVKAAEAKADTIKFYDNLDADLENVKENPALAAKFREIYPPSFHAKLDKALESLGYSSRQQQGQQGPDKAVMPPELMQRFQSMESKLSEHEKRAFESEVSAAQAEIDATITKMSTKFPYAYEHAVLAKADAFIKQGNQMTEKAWEALYKAENERETARYQAFYKEQINKQKAAQTKAKDSGPSGSAPSSAPKRQTMKEARESLERDTGGRSF